MTGGGFVDGIVFHPTEKNLYYCRTDMGGAYRWSEEQNKWIPLLDWVSYEDWNLMGVESIALDANDPDALFLACGTYTNENVPDGAVLYSFDQGQTFQRTDVPFKFGGNENGRGNGERMQVDPNNGNIIFLGTRNDGLWKSTDRAKTWTKVISFPGVTENPPADLSGNDLGFWYWAKKGSGINVLLFDPESGSPGSGSQVIYAAVSLKDRPNLFRSTNGGESWEEVPGAPRDNRPNHMVRSADGHIYVSYGSDPGPWGMTDGSVWKYNPIQEKWTDITPDRPDAERKFGYVAVAVDPRQPQTILTTTFFYPGGEEIFRSTDAGASWKPVFRGGGTFNDSLAPYTRHTGIHWLFDIEINPHNSDHAIFTTGYGGHETFNLTEVDRNKPTTWHIMSSGIEETVPLELLSPPEGAQLITAIGDYGGFVHHNLDEPVPEGNFVNPHFGNTDGVACAELQPNIIVRVGVASHGSTAPSAAYSFDYGKTWTPVTNMPSETSKHGHIAVSADGSTWIWTPGDELPHYSIDSGKSWQICRGTSENMRIVADRVNPNKFYGLDLIDGKILISENAGVDFDVVDLLLPEWIPGSTGNRGDSRGGQDRLYATPGLEGELWIAAFDGLYRSTDGGKSFNRIQRVEEIHGFGFGKAAPGGDYPALYLVGVVDELRGIFRSDDCGETWVRINDDEHQWGLILHITGDPKKYGRAYIGTHGRGALYGDPANRAE